VARTAWLTCFALLASSLSHADPLAVADQNPLLSGFTAAPLPARIDSQNSWSLEASFAWGSSAVMQANAHESLIADAETRELRFIAQRSFADHYALRLELPYRHTSAGSLDGFIDRWHDIFGLPEGARPSLPEDALRLFYRRDGSVRLDSSSAAMQGLGDVSIELGRTLISTQESAVTGWIGLKLPTGDAEDFTGSGSVDVDVTIAAQRRFAGRWQVFGQVAGTWLGDGDRLVELQRNWMWSASAGVSARAIGSLTLTLQVDAHSAVFDSDLDFLGDAVALSIGGTYRFASDWQLALGVSEDIAVETTSDVVFLFELKKIF
jgi:hypothetical protein